MPDPAMDEDTPFDGEASVPNPPAAPIDPSLPANPNAPGPRPEAPPADTPVEPFHQVEPDTEQTDPESAAEVRHAHIVAGSATGGAGGDGLG